MSKRHCIYTKNNLATWESLKKEMLEKGLDEASLDFIHAVSVCPKGHHEHLSQEDAEKKFFPGMNAIDAKAKVLDATLTLMEHLFAKQ